MLVLGVAAAFLGLLGAGSQVTRRRYGPDRWRLPEGLVLGSGAVAATLAVVASRGDLVAAYPPLDAWPTLTLTHLVVAGVALAGGLAAPLPHRTDVPVAVPMAVTVR
jgi:energy-coupling factor transport system permease protein